MKTRSSTRKNQEELPENEENIEEKQKQVCENCYSKEISTPNFNYKEKVCKKCYLGVSRLKYLPDSQQNDRGIQTKTNLGHLIRNFKLLPLHHLAVLLFCIGCYLLGSLVFKSLEKYSTHKKCTDVKEVLAEVILLRAEFPKQFEETWLDFAAGIDGVVNSQPARPTTFLLLHENGAETVASGIAVRVSQLAASCMNGMVLQLEGAQLGKELSSDSGRLLTEYKDKIQAAKVVYVSNFHQLPAELVKQFHHLCDFHQPIVPRVVYVFVMPVSILPTNSNKTAAAESALQELWSAHLHSYILDPLITRITGNVISVQS